MTCKHCGQNLTRVGDEWWAVKYQDGEGLIDGDTTMCVLPIDKGKWSKFQSTYFLVPHEPSKNSIVIDILKDL